MGARWLRSAIYSLALVLAAGCGGGSGSGSGGGGGNNPTTVTFTVKGATPTAVAAKIGSGAFAAKTLMSGTLTLSIPDGTSGFAVAYACPPQTIPVILGLGTETQQTVLQASTADGTSFTMVCPEAPTAIQTDALTGSLDATAIVPFSYLTVQAANGDAVTGTFLAFLTGTFSFAAPKGSDRVEVLAYQNSPLGTLPPWSELVAARTFDNQQVPGALNGGNPVVLTAADKTSFQPITYNNVPSSFSPPTTLVNLSAAGKAGFVVATGGTNSYPSLPATAVENGDAYTFISVTYQNQLGGIGGPGQAMAVAATTPTGGPMTFTFPAPWPYAGPTPAALPSFDFSYSGFDGKTGVNQRASLNWFTGTAAEGVFNVLTTTNYLHGATQVSFPDLSSVTGFLPAPASGTRVNWFAIIGQNGYPALQTASTTETGSAVLNIGMYIAP